MSLVSRELALISPKHGPYEKHMVIPCNTPHMKSLLHKQREGNSSCLLRKKSLLKMLMPYLSSNGKVTPTAVLISNYRKS